MKFGAFVPQGWRLDLATVEPGYPQYQAMREAALKLERLGYDGLWLYDHFHTIPEHRPEATFEAWTALTALAEATSRIRLGHMCGCAFYRPPALLAKISANLDVISRGRLELGIGAGWYQHEAVAYGYDFERPALRIARLDEAVRIIRGMWTQDEFQFEGRYYRVGIGRVRDYQGRSLDLAGAINHPKPLQQPHPPLWIGGGGEQLTLRTVARYADWSNFMGPLETVKHKNAVLDAHCEKAGRNPAEVRRSLCLNVVMGTEAEFDAALRATGRSPEHVEGLKRMLWPGRADQLLEELGRYREEGRIDYAILYFPDAVVGESMERFAEEVMPGLRSAPARA